MKLALVKVLGPPMDFSPWCKECISKRDKELAIKRNKKRKEETLPDGMKRCAKPSCNKILPLSKFQSTTARRTTPTACVRYMQGSP